MTDHERDFARSTVSTSVAALLLDVHPQELRRWVEELGFPDTTVRNDRRAFPAEQIAALQAALAVGLPVSEAIAVAREERAAAHVSIQAAEPAMRSTLRARNSHRNRCLGGRVSRPALLSLLLAGSLALAPAASARLSSRGTSTRRLSMVRLAHQPSRAVPRRSSR